MQPGVSYWAGDSEPRAGPVGEGPPVIHLVFKAAKNDSAAAALSRHAPERLTLMRTRWLSRPQPGDLSFEFLHAHAPLEKGAGPAPDVPAAGCSPSSPKVHRDVLVTGDSYSALNEVQW